jgi:Ca-activated chloride channel family protein
MTFYDAQTMTVRYDLYHTLNVRGNPDTLNLDPIVKYNLDVHTIPPLEQNNILLTSNSHNTITLNAPQGSLHIGSANKNDVKILVKKNETQTTLHVQNMNATEKYLVGKYAIEILTLPRIEMNNIDISQSKTTNISIPPPGNLNIEKNGEIYGGVFYLKENVWIKLQEFKYKLLQENVSLQPGNYRIIYRNKANKRMKQTVNKDIVIKSNQTLNVTL